jgi:hypothetical protein
MFIYGVVDVYDLELLVIFVSLLTALTYSDPRISFFIHSRSFQSLLCHSIIHPRVIHSDTCSGNLLSAIFHTCPYVLFCKGHLLDRIWPSGKCINTWKYWWLVEELCYKPEGRWIYSRWGHCIFQLTKSFQPRYSPEVHTVSNTNEYQESSLVLRATVA